MKSRFVSIISCNNKIRISFVCLNLLTYFYCFWSYVIEVFSVHNFVCRSQIWLWLTLTYCLKYWRNVIEIFTIYMILHAHLTLTLTYFLFYSNIREILICVQSWTQIYYSDIFQFYSGEWYRAIMVVLKLLTSSKLKTGNSYL